VVQLQAAAPCMRQAAGVFFKKGKFQHVFYLECVVSSMASP
jgi:hypothetical protein